MSDRCVECGLPSEYRAFYYARGPRELCEAHAKGAVRDDNPPYKMKRRVHRVARKGSQLKLGI